MSDHDSTESQTPPAVTSDEPDFEQADFVEIADRPDVLPGTTQCIETADEKIYVNINEDPETGLPFELFCNTGDSGTYTSAWTEALAKTISLALRAGVDPRELASELQGIRHEGTSWNNGDTIESVPDAIGTAMQRQLDGDVRASAPEQVSLDDIDANEGTDASTDQPSSSSDSEKSNPPDSPVNDTSEDSTVETHRAIEQGENPECPECGSLSLYYSEGCKSCESCGWSEC